MAAGSGAERSASAVIPTLRGVGLILRPLLPADAGSLVDLMRDPQIAEPYVLPRYPWTLATAHAEIEAMQANFDACRRLDLGIVPTALSSATEAPVIGVMSLAFVPAHDRAELGFWVGHPYWGQGYGRRASALLLEWSFAERRLQRVTARTLGDNVRAARLLQSLGFQKEGVLRQHQYHWGRFRDVALWGRLATDTGAQGSCPKAWCSSTGRMG